MKSQSRISVFKSLRLSFSLLLPLALVLAACSGGGAATTAPTTEATSAPAATEVMSTPEATMAETTAATEMVTAAPMVTGLPGTGGTAEVTAMPAMTEAVTPVPLTTEMMTATQMMSGTAMPAGEATVMVATDPKLGKILVDDKGMTLYIYTKDTPDKSNCSAGCLKAWPPLLSLGAPKAGTGVDASMLGTATTTDGRKMVTYNHMPLYYYVKDMKPGDVTGQAVGGVWWVIGPDGKPIMTGAPASTTAPAMTATP